MSDAAVPPTRSHPRGWIIGAGLVLVGLVLVVLAVVDGRAGEGPSDAGGTGRAGLSSVTAPTTPDGIGEGWADERGGRRALRGFGEVAATFTDASGRECEVCLLLARSSEQHQRGLMEVTDEDLGGYDGMLFEFDGDATGAFWMRNTPMPLSIAYFDGGRQLVSTVDMAPCEDRPDCPSYPPGGPYRYALEVPQGRLPDVGVAGDGSHFRITARTCPAAAG